jgi:predicted RNA-binding protein YlxR (DUF448 family)
MGKHIPQRTCVICRDRTSKRALIRLVRTENGVFVDPTGKMQGRGAYLCDDPLCWSRALAGEVLGRALRTTLTPEDRERLKQAQPV